MVYSAVKAHQFFAEESWDSFKQIFDTYMLEASKVLLRKLPLVWNLLLCCLYYGLPITLLLRICLGVESGREGKEFMKEKKKKRKGRRMEWEVNYYSSFSLVWMFNINMEKKIKEWK